MGVASVPGAGDMKIHATALLRVTIEIPDEEEPTESELTIAQEELEADLDEFCTDYPGSPDSRVRIKLVRSQ